MLDIKFKKLNKITKGALLIISVFLTFTIFAEEVSAVTHPNLLVNQAEINQIKQNVFTNKYSWAVNAYNTIRSNADSKRGVSIYSDVFDAMESARDSAIVYALTGETDYADEAKRVLLDFASDTSMRPERTLEGGYWLPDVCLAYDLIYNYGDLSGSDKWAIEEMLKTHGRWLDSENWGNSNWQGWHNAGAAAAGFVTGDSTLIDNAINQPDNGFRDWIRDAIYGDGTGIYWESIGYGIEHVLPANLRTAEMAWHNGIDLYNWKASNGNSLKMLADGPLYTAYPNLYWLGIDDSWSHPLDWEVGSYELAYLRYQDPVYGWLIERSERPANYFTLFFGRPITSSKTPVVSSINNQGKGWSILRTSSPSDYFDSDAISVLFDYGPHEGFHGHADKLQIDIFGYQKFLAPDSNLYAYFDEEGKRHYGWDKQTPSHNTVVVDMTPQPGVLEPCYPDTKGDSLFFKLAPTFKVAQASANKVYSDEGISDYRRLLALTDFYILDAFRIQSGSTHTYDWALQGIGSLTTSGLSFSSGSLGMPSCSGYDCDGYWQDNGCGYDYITSQQKASTANQWSVSWSSGLKTTMLNSPNTEVYKGMAPTPTHNTGTDEEPIVVARRNTASTVFAAVHEPYGTSPQITSITKLADTLGATGVEIKTGSLTDVVLLDQDTASLNTYGSYSFDGKAALVRKDSSNRLTKISMMQGTSLKEGSIELVKSSNSAASFEIAFSYGSLRLDITSEDSATLTIYALASYGTTSVYVNGNPASFTRSGDYVIVNLAGGPPPTCTLNSVSITPQCSGGSSSACEAGEKIKIDVSYSGDCPSTAYIQVDAKSSDGACDIQGSGGDMVGIQTTCTSGACTGYWTIPAVANDCLGKTVTAYAAGIWQNGFPGTGTWVAGKSGSFGSFSFAGAAPTTPCFKNRGIAVHDKAFGRDLSESEKRRYLDEFKKIGINFVRFGPYDGVHSYLWNMDWMMTELKARGMKAIPTLLFSSWDLDPDNSIVSKYGNDPDILYWEMATDEGSTVSDYDGYLNKALTKLNNIKPLTSRPIIWTAASPAIEGDPASYRKSDIAKFDALGLMYYRHYFPGGDYTLDEYLTIAEANWHKTIVVVEAGTIYQLGICEDRYGGVEAELKDAFAGAHKHNIETIGVFGHDTIINNEDWCESSGSGPYYYETVKNEFLCTPPPSTCTLNSVSIAPQCTGGSSTNCEAGEKIKVDVSYSGDCPSTSYIQVDAKSSDGICDIQGSGGDMVGIQTTCTSSSCTGYWTIPAVVSDCLGKTVSAYAAGLYQNDYNPSNYITGKSGSFGSFSFAMLYDVTGKNISFSAMETKIFYLRIKAPNIKPGEKVLVNVSATGSTASSVATIEITEVTPISVIPINLSFSGKLYYTNGTAASDVAFKATVYNETRKESYYNINNTEADGKFYILITGINPVFPDYGFLVRLETLQPVETVYECRYDPKTEWCL